MSEVHDAPTRYDTDFHAWTAEQAGLLRAHRLAELDLLNIAEEIDALGGSVRRELESRLEVLVAHLLKWRFQPQRRSRSWQSTIVVQRRDIARISLSNPSLGARRHEHLQDVYDFAVRLAEIETGLPRTTFPAVCPWTIEQVLDDACWPEPD